MTGLNEAAYSHSWTYGYKEMSEFLKDEYSWWSTIARTIHLKYKMYSADCLNEDGLLNDPGKVGVGNFNKAYNVEKFKSIAIDKENELHQRLVWLEHRRWNAFMRTIGYNSPSENQWDQYAFNESENADHKHLELKLHPCIVESSFDFNISPEDWDDPDFQKNKRLDYLDIVSIRIYQRKKTEGIEPAKQTDYKEYDRPKPENI